MYELLIAKHPIISWQLLPNKLLSTEKAKTTSYYLLPKYLAQFIRLSGWNISEPGECGR